MPANRWLKQEKNLMAKKGYGVKHLSAPGMSYKPKSNMTLHGKHAESMKAHNVGDDVELTVKAKKTGHSIDPMDGNHRSEYEIHSIKENDADEVSGPNTKGAKNGADDSDSRQ